MRFKGSKTEKNLEAVFAQESQAHSKYTFFADAAKDDGFGQIAGVFHEAADNEKAHARRVFTFLKGIGDTKANLEVAAQGEHAEWSKVYPEFERVAREEGFTEIAGFFKGVAKAEELHERRYRALLKDVEEKKVSKKGKKVVWKCRNCGWISEATEAPDECPTCKLPQSGFETFNTSFIIWAFFC